MERPSLHQELGPAMPVSPGLLAGWLLWLFCPPAVGGTADVPLG